MMRPAISLVLASCVALGALAAEVAGTHVDDTITVAGKDLVLNGAGVRTRAIFKVYVAALYLPGKTTDAAAALEAPARRVQLTLLRTLSADQLVDALNDGLKDNNTEAELAAVKPQVDQLASIMRAFKEVREKDVVTIDFIDRGTRIALNGTSKGAIVGEPFNRALLKVWIGDRPVQTDLKKAMLGG